jgi:hypothetical protein
MEFNGMEDGLSWISDSLRWALGEFRMISDG